MLSILADASSTMFFPSQASTVAAEVDWLFNFIYYVSAFFFVLVVGVMIYFVLKYYRRPGHTEQPTPSHHEGLEITWSVIPSIIVGIIFYFGFTGYLNLREAPENSYEIQVISSQWKFTYVYPNGHSDTELHIPVNRPVRFLISSQDVLHSFFIPAFRIKMDAVPGRFTTTWVNATDVTGQGIDPNNHSPYDLFCAEYCGQQHSTMRSKVYVHESGEFEAWLEDAGNLLGKYPPEEAGKILYEKRCQQCHTIDGTNPANKAGPTFKGAWGMERQVIPRGASAPETVVMDENYVLESIRQPNAKIVLGRNPGMPVFDTRQLKDEEIAAIISFFKTLN